jgi:hypothetical protein
MRPELPAILDSVANDFDASGSQYATLAALIREAARELKERASPPLPSTARAPAGLVLDSDGIPSLGRPCVNCEI